MATHLKNEKAKKPAPDRIKVAVPWLLIYGLLLLKAACVQRAHLNVPQAPTAVWTAVASAFPVAWWTQRRVRVARPWGACRFLLQSAAEPGSPFLGVIEASTRFAPTEDICFRLSYGLDDGDSIRPIWQAEQFVDQNRMDDTGPTSRIPVRFETLAPTSETARRQFEIYGIWWLEFRAKLNL